MAWSLESTGNVLKGTGEVAGHLAGEAFSTLTSPLNFIRKHGQNSYLKKEKELDKIATPVSEGKYGTNRQFAFSNQGFGKDRTSRLAKHFTKDQFKGFGYGLGISSGVYGLVGYATDNNMNNAGDRMAHYGKHAVALGADIASDITLSVAAAGIATLGGPAGVFVAGGLKMFNMFAGFAGIDAGSIAMNVMNYADEEYERRKSGPTINMTQNTSMALQRQIQNMHASGSNLGEMMHN
jgi:hypothetical protein